MWFVGYIAFSETLCEIYLPLDVFNFISIFKCVLCVFISVRILFAERHVRYCQHAAYERVSLR